MSDSTSPDWAANAADRVVSEVDKIRDRTVPVAQTVAKAFVYVPLVICFGIIIAVLVVIALIRLLDIVLPIWGVYVLLGAIFTLLGLFIWKKRGRLEP